LEAFVSDAFFLSCVGDSLQYSRKSKKEKSYDWCFKIVYGLVGIKVNHLNILSLLGRLKSKSLEHIDLHESDNSSVSLASQCQ
jgi:hypothetical protein